MSMKTGQIWQRDMTDITGNKGDYVQAKITEIDSGIVTITTTECNCTNSQWRVGDTHKLILGDRSMSDYDWFLIEDAEETPKSLAPGYNCAKCHLYFSCVAPNHGDEYICYECRRR